MYGIVVARIAVAVVAVLCMLQRCKSCWLKYWHDASARVVPREDASASIPGLVQARLAGGHGQVARVDYNT